MPGRVSLAGGGLVVQVLAVGRTERLMFYNISAVTVPREQGHSSKIT